MININCREDALGGLNIRGRNYYYLPTVARHGVDVTEEAIEALAQFL